MLIGEDCIARWPEFLDVIVVSIAENGGRSCINASVVVVPRHGDEIADVLAWTVSVASLSGVDVEAAAARYAQRCPKCGQVPCACAV